MVSLLLGGLEGANKEGPAQFSSKGYKWRVDNEPGPSEHFPEEERGGTAVAIPACV